MTKSRRYVHKNMTRCVATFQQIFVRYEKKRASDSRFSITSTVSLIGVDCNTISCVSHAEIWFVLHYHLLRIQLYIYINFFLPFSLSLSFSFPSSSSPPPPSDPCTISLASVKLLRFLSQQYIRKVSQYQKYSDKQW